MEVGAVEVKVKEISAAAVTKDNSEATIIMVTMTVAEAIAISITEEVVDKMVVEGDLEAATTGEAQQTNNTSEEVVAEVEVAEVMVGTTRRDTSITVVVIIKTPKI